MGGPYRHSVPCSCVKTAEPILMPFGMWIRVVPMKHYHGVTWRNLANTTERCQPSYVRRRVDAAFVNYFDHLLWPPYVADADIIFCPVVSFFSWSPYRIEQTIMFSSCGFFLFSSPNLSRRRLDVWHTSTHGWPYCEFRMHV